MVEKKWRVAPADPGKRDRLARDLNASPIFASLLLNRGVSTAEEARRYLDPKLTDLHDPFLLPDMELAALRIQEALRRKEAIAVCGDYDVDGLTATALLVEFFRLLDHPVCTYIPHRIEDGYGLNADAVRRLAGEGVRLLVTVDNGSSALEEIALAVELGVDVVVTDHHQLPAVPPDALALVNPWAPGAEYPFPQLAGVGVAFKLVWAIAQRLSRSKKVSPEFREFMLEALSLVALGTVSDVVPLSGENRILAKHGLVSLARSSRPGLQKLAEYALRGNGGPLKAEHVAFRIAPSLNAAGRLGNAELALGLLLAATPEEAQSILGLLDAENRRRQKIEEEILITVRERVRSEIDFASDRAIVLAAEGWHPGVVGIVAARLAEEFCRPTLLIALEGNRGRGSARSIAGVHICEALKKCSEHLMSFGGHAQAAGVEVIPDRIEALRRAIQEAIPIAPRDMIPQMEIEAEVELGDLSPGLLHELSRLEPHGHGNREPLFLARALAVSGAPRSMGQNGKHLSFFVRGERSAPLKAVGFRWGELSGSLPEQGSRVDLVFQPFMNRWGGEERIELNVKAIREA